MISISEVRVSQDLKNADIYISFYRQEDTFNREKYFKELYKYKNNIKYKLGQSLKLKYVPKINFMLSDDYIYYDKINRLLKDNE